MNSKTSSFSAAPDFSRARVLVAGDVMLDRYWFGDAHRISPEAPVPVVRIARTEERLGGAGNVARNVAALGAKARLLAVVGEDDAAQSVERIAQEAGVQVRLVRDAGGPTTVKMRVIGRQQQLMRIDFEEHPHPLALDRIAAAFEAALADSDVVVCSDYAKGALERIPGLIAAARAAGKPVLVDPKGDDYERYRGATLLTPNRTEAREALGRWKDEEDLTGRAQALRSELELDALLVTRSEEGMTLFTAQGRFHENTHAREVFDVTGAGDTVIAVLAASLAAGADLLTAMRYANRAGGIVVGKLGTATVTPQELFAMEAKQ
jgi:rfaE bifunctional protein kinase chain/domain